MRNPRLDAPTETMRLHRDLSDGVPAARWSLPNSPEDWFWPAFVLLLAGAVILVASVAHSSMATVGVAPAAQILAPAPDPTATGGTTLIVQASSHTTRSAAKAAAQELGDRGIQTRVLISDNYRPLNPGYYVVYTGPYPATTDGRAEAKRIQSKLPGALLRDIEAR